MPMIEGVGDEVLQFFLIIILILVGIIAWRSTGLSDRQIIRTVLILERRSRHQVLAELPVSPTVATAAIENSIDTGQVDSPSTDETREETPSPSCLKENEPTSEAAGTSQDNQDPPCVDLDAQERDLNAEFCNPIDSSSNEHNVDEPSVVRQRRLAFFQSRQETLLEPPSNNTHDFFTEISHHSEREEQAHASTSGRDSPIPGNIRIRLMYLNDDQKLVEGRLEEMLGDFKRRHFALELAADKLVRLIFNGKVLQRDSETLQSLGLFDNCVVHCLVHQQRGRSGSHSSNSTRTSRRGSNSATASGSSAGNDTTGQRDWDLGNLLFASLSVLLCVAWYCRYQYPSLFNTTTTVALAGMTGVLVVSLVGLYLPDPDFVRH